MGATVTLDVNTTSLLGAIGLVDGDGRLDAAWFSDPMAAIRRIVADPDQRAALLELLASLLPGDGSGGPGHERVPLLDRAGRGNIYLTVDGDVVGVAAELSTPPGVTPGARIALRMALVSTVPELRAIAGSPEAPLELSLDLELGDAVAGVGALRVRATVDVEGGAALRFALDGVDVGQGPQTLEVSAEHFGRDVVRAVEVLVRDALAGLPAQDPLAAHLLGALGLDGVLPALALDELAADATRIRAWLAQLAATPGHLEAWFAHVAGLLGAEPPPASEPLAARIAVLGDGAELVLRLELAGGALAVSIGVVAAGAAARLEASATLLSIALDAAEPVRLVPRTSLALRAPGPSGPLADALPAVRVGSLTAGVAFDGTGLVPELRLRDVVLDGVVYPSLDLTDAHAVVDAGSAAIRDAIEAAVGSTTGPARALLALLGVVAPAGDPASLHLVDAAALARSPTSAIADVHRAVLGDAAHGWAHMLRAIGDLAGLDAGAPTGAGTAADPWRLALAGGGDDGGGPRLDLAAWDARDDATPDGERRLRVGLLLTAGAALAPWSPRVRSELLAFDLPPSGPATVRLIGEQRVELELSPVPDAVSETGLLSVRASALRGVLAWRPGAPVAITASVDGLRVAGAGGDDEVGPFTLAFPPADAGGPDLGLGGGAGEVLEALRGLLRHAAQDWGGDGARALGELLGVFGDGPRLDPPELDDPGSLLGRPGDALRDLLRRLATELGDDGEPHAERALARLLALLRDQVPRASDGFTPRLDVAVGGAGTYDDPWSLPLHGPAGGDAGAAAELLAWLDPAGPPASWAPALAARVAGTTGGRALTALLPRLTAFASGLPAWAAPDALGDALDALGVWLAGGDGLSALTSQLPELPGWRHGDVLATPHADQPADPLAIAQIAAQLGEWADEAGERAVLLVGPAWSTHEIWDDLLAAVDPARDGAAHFDLRGGQPTQAVTAVATHYTADLLDDAGGDLDALSAQLSAVVDRVRALTGRERVTVVAHSTAGIAARVLAGARAEVIRGLVTLGTAHAGDVPRALTDPRLADAVRAVRAIAGGADGGADALPARLHAALAALDGALDRAAGAVAPGAFVPVPAGTPNEVPGLALGSALGGNLVASLGELLAGAVTSAAAARPPQSAPTQLGIGVRVRLPIGSADAAGVRLDVDARIDGARLALRPGAPEPPRPAHALQLRARADRPGGWLVGEPVGDGPRIRSAELALSVVAGAGGAVSVTPRLRLRDVVLGAARRDLELGDDGLDAALDLLGTALGSSATGADLAELVALVRSPPDVLRGQRDALLDALSAKLGGELAVRLADPPLELSLDRASWTLRLRGTTALALADGVGATLDAGLSLTTFAPTLHAGLQAGAIALDYTTARGTLQLAAPPWLDALTVAPAPPPAVLRAALAPLVPRVALSAALSAALGGLLDDARATVRALDRVLADPGAALAQLRPIDVQDLLRSCARALGTDDADGLGLPGGLLLRATGADALRLQLSGSLALADPGDALALGLTLDVAPDRTVTPGGSLALDVGLPGDWGRVAVAFTASPSGVGLAVTPQGVAPITLLPVFGGFGDLLEATARRLLPRVLQALVDALRPPTTPPTPPAGLLGAALDLATELQVYADDAQGFEAPARAARLAAMLAPGWLEAQTADPAQLAALIAAILAAAPPPVGVIAADGAQIAWTAPLPVGGGRLQAALTLGDAPAATLTVTELDAGPLVVEHARAGYAGGALTFALRLRLDPGGELAFLRPVAELGVDAAGLTASLLPLGPQRRADLELRLAPAFDALATPAGALGLVTSWGLPLVTLLGLRSAGDALERRLWPQGPSARRVLADAGVVTPAGPPKPASALPDLPAIALGALRGLAADATIALTPTLALAVVDDGAGRKGVRLKGRQDVAGSAIGASVRFGEADWLEDANAGVTLWLIRPSSGTPPVALDLALDAVGIGAVFGAPGGAPLLDGLVTIGRAGGLLFFALDFLDPQGRPALTAGELGAALELHDARLAVQSSDGDGFLQKLLPASLQAPFSLAVEARAGRGIELHGGPPESPGAGGPGADPLALRIPLDTQIGPLTLGDLVVGLRTPDGGAELVAGIDATGALGPVRVSVRNVGARARLTGDAGGAIAVELAFKAPDGAALKLDAGPIVGAGFLAHDAARSQYAGGVDLEFAKLRLSAIGLLATKLPDGRPGFSLLVVINARFPQPIPLGFGFNLAAVGGIVGINRAVDVARLRGGMREGSLSTILSPGDVVGNERRLLSELGELFPVTPGRHLFGPTASLTWGTPTIVTVDIALALELPQPLRFIAAGRVRLALPDARKPVAEINLDALGVLDTGAGTLELDATLYDSQIAGWQLSGDMALRARWTRPSQFVMSAGGFHPRFKAPPNFPALRRMALSIGEGKVWLRLEAYLALTSNTLQLGSRVELHAQSGDFVVAGHFSFDALVRFSPFGFELDVSIGLSLRWKGRLIAGLTADLYLTGPGRWYVRGRVTVEVLFLSATVRFEGSFGRAPQIEPVPLQPVLGLVHDALRARGAWEVQERAPLPALTLRQEISLQELLVSPSALVTVRQKVAPLGGAHLDRLGEARIAGPAELRVRSATLGGQPAAFEDVKDEFAPAQYFDMSDEDKLSSPAFDLMSSGIRFRATASLSFDDAGPDAVVIGYRTLIVDAPDAPLRAAGHAANTLAAATGAAAAGPDFALGGDELSRLAHDGAAGRAATRDSGLQRFAAPGLAMRVQPDAFLVVSAATLAPAGPQPAADERWSRSEALQHLRRWRAAQPDGADELTVVPAPDAGAAPVAAGMR